MTLKNNLPVVLVIALFFGIAGVAPAHAQSDIGVLSTDAYIDSLGFYHVVGEVRNNSDGVVRFVEIIADFYDANNTSIGRASGFTFIDVMRQTEKSAFHLMFTDPVQIPKIKTYKVTVHVGVLTSDKHRLLDLKVGQGHFDDLGFYHLTGQVTNNGENTARFVQVSAAFYDSNGKIVDTAVGYTSPPNITPGKTETFEIQSVSPSGYSIKTVSANADSTEYATTPEFPVTAIAALAGTVGIVILAGRLKARLGWG